MDSEDIQPESCIECHVAVTLTARIILTSSMSVFYINLIHHSEC